MRFLLLLFMTLALPASAGDHTPFGAADGVDLARSAAESWAADARLVYVENDEDVPLRQYDKILFHPKDAIPVDLEHDNQLFVVPVEDVVAVFRREEPTED